MTREGRRLHRERLRRPRVLARDVARRHGALFDPEHRLPRRAVEHEDEPHLRDLDHDRSRAARVRECRPGSAAPAGRSPTGRGAPAARASGGARSRHRAPRASCRTGSAPGDRRRRSRTTVSRSAGTRARGPHRRSSRTTRWHPCGAATPRRTTCRARARRDAAPCGSATAPARCARRRRAHRPRVRAGSLPGTRPPTITRSRQIAGGDVMAYASPVRASTPGAQVEHTRRAEGGPRPPVHGIERHEAPVTGAGEDRALGRCDRIRPTAQRHDAAHSTACVSARLRVVAPVLAARVAIDGDHDAGRRGDVHAPIGKHRARLHARHLARSEWDRGRR